MKINLTDPIESIFRPNPIQKKVLDRLNLTTLADLLFYLPNRHETPGVIRKINELQTGEEVTIFGRLLKAKIAKAHFKKIPLGEATIEDETGKIKAIWFHQAFLAKKIPEGKLVKLRGRIGQRKDVLYLANPEIELATSFNQALFGSENLGLVAVYPETRYLSSGWFNYHIQKILKLSLHEQVVDPIPAEILKKYNLPSLKTALVWIHSAQNTRDAEVARKRFAFEEILFIQLARLRDRQNYKNNTTFNLPANKSETKKFIERFPFKFTPAQLKAIQNINNDFSTGQPMTRLLEGDVGSGKTAVAATTAFNVVHAGGEVAYMAPTEILAKQHFESFISYFSHLNVQVGLITGSGCYKFPSKISAKNYTNISRNQLLKWVANGEIPIVVGTHALIQKTVKFKNLAYVIIDEQHRFGVMQRSKLVRKNDRVPHLLSMTATPIPRTLALTIYGDLDLTLLDQMPSGRKPIITELVTEQDRAKIYEKIRTELQAGRQAYIICPRIDPADSGTNEPLSFQKIMASQLKSARSEQKRLQDKIFPEFRVGLVHSKLKPKDKDQIMKEFSDHEIDILVATSVVEVGVNVPNATMIMIEGAERFGLAQLHQLRGRVIRSNHQAYCFVVSDTKSQKSLDRLKALKTAKNGFELAEMDLALRGAGLLSGEKQWGLSDLGMEAIKNIKMVEAARKEAQEILKKDPELKKNPLIAEKIKQQKRVLHFE